MPTFLDDQAVIDPSTVEPSLQQFPAAQWMNGDPKQAAHGGIAHTGGLVLPAKYVDESVAPAPGWTRTTVAFSSGKSEAVFAAPKARLAVIRTRFRWFVTYNGVTTFYPREGYVPESGMRGHVQALCYAHGFDFAFTATFKGKASQEFEKLLKEFSQKVGDAAQKLARAKDPKAGRFPRFAFYMRLAPGPHTKVGKKGQESIITPPVLEVPSAISDEYMNKIYVGREALLVFQQAYLDSASWGAAWGKPGAEESHDEERDPAEVDQATGEVLADEYENF